MLLPVLLPPAILELFTEVISLDIKALTIDTPGLASQLGPAFEKYNEEQFATVKLPGSSQSVSSLLQGTGIAGGSYNTTGHSQFVQLSWRRKILRC